MSSKIYVYSPSGVVVDLESFGLATEQAKNLGYDLNIDESCLNRSQRFAGTDETRILAITRACESNANVAMISRGGYGISRLLQNIPYSKIAESISQGVAWLGFSDFTALQIALYLETGCESWHGQAFIETFGRKEIDNMSYTFFQKVLEHDLHGMSWHLPKLEENLYQNFKIENTLLWGGNLTMICSLLGTAWCPTKISLGILYIEEVNESPYRIERLMLQLLYSGVFSNQKAILLGAFTGSQTTSLDLNYNVATVFDWLRSQLNIPVLTNLPIGHLPSKVILPFGKMVNLELISNEARINWD